jgi:CheY-like chemotaxis protein
MKLTITIGPVPTASALAWIAAANETLSVLREHTDLDVPWDVLTAFEKYVDTWTAHAERHPETFHWSDEVDEAIVRKLGLHWARIVSVTRSGRRPDLSTAPPEGAAFYDAIATAIADGLASAEDSMGAAFADAVPAFDSPPRLPPTGAPTRVLIVDDHDDIRMLLRVWLEGDPGFEVAAEAADGHAAIEAARATKPDVALLDVQMPGMSGIEALPLIKAVAPECAVIVFSAGEQRTEAFAAGAVAYVSKTEPMVAVLGAVSEAAAGRSGGRSG